jgi:glucose/arabinose dehydrogenase
VRARALVVLTLALSALAIAPSAHAAVHTNQIANVPRAVFVTAPPADAHRVMVVAQDGKVFVVRDGVQLADPFLDVSADVQYGGEQGLLSIAFAPDYATSRKLYAYYDIPNPSGDKGGQIVVDEFTASSDDHVDKSTRRRLLTIDHPTDTNHNGGTLAFGPDGRLYAGTGDGGGGNDSHHNAQNPNSLLGKMLVIDRVNGGASVYASGLRNPYRWSFDRATGDLVIGDVGQGAEEEIDYAPAGTGFGANYGWPCYEGFERTPGVSACDPPGYVPPVLEQPHAGAGFCAIIGGYVVRDPGLTDLLGRYIYGDNCQKQVRSAKLAQPRVTDDAPVAGLTISSTSGFGEDSCGHVFVASLNGPVYRLDGDAPPVPCPEPTTGGGPNPSPTGDNTAPQLKLTRARIQRVLRTKAVVAAVRCSEACGFTATGRMRVSGVKKTYVLAKVAKLVAKPGARTKIKLRLSKAALKALRRHHRASAMLTVVARDAAGNERSGKASVRAKR